MAAGGSQIALLAQTVLPLPPLSLGLRCAWVFVYVVAVVPVPVAAVVPISVVAIVPVPVVAVVPVAVVAVVPAIAASASPIALLAQTVLPLPPLSLGLRCAWVFVYVVAVVPVPVAAVIPISVVAVVPVSVVAIIPAVAARGDRCQIKFVAFAKDDCSRAQLSSPGLLHNR